MILGVFLKRDTVVNFPINQAVSAVADPSFGLGPTIPIFLHGALVDRKICREGRKRGEVGSGMVEVNAESERVGSFDPDRFRVGLS